MKDAEFTAAPFQNIMFEAKSLCAPQASLIFGEMYVCSYTFSIAAYSISISPMTKAVANSFVSRHFFELDREGSMTRPFALHKLEARLDR